MRIALVLCLVVSASAFGQEAPQSDAPVAEVQEAPQLTPRAQQLRQELYDARVYRGDHSIGFAVTGAVLSRLVAAASLLVSAATPNYDSSKTTWAAVALGAEVVHLGFVILSMVRLGQQSWANGYIHALEDEAARLGLAVPREF